jgi:hypothetical protein
MKHITLLFLTCMLAVLSTSAQWAYPYEITNTLRPDDVVMADIDSDGLNDIVGASGEGIAWCRRLENGEYAPLESLVYWGGGTWANVYGLCVADYDLDGDPDFVIMRTVFSEDIYYRKLVMIWNQGNLIFSEEQMLIPDIHLFPVTQDLDGDGYMDLVVGEGLLVKVLLNNQAGGFVVNDELSLIDEYSTDLKMLDYDQDGLLDILYLDHGYAELRFGKGLGEGYFQDPITIFANGDGPANGEFQDMNGDGLLDLIQLNNIGSDSEPIYGFTIRYNSIDSGFGDFVEVTNPSISPESASYRFVDWNNDEIKDVIVILPQNQTGEVSQISFLHWTDAQTLELDFSITDEMDFASVLYPIEADDDDGIEFLIGDYGNAWRIMNINENSAEISEGLDNSLGVIHDESVVDLDLDGDLDIVSFCSTNGRLGWYENIGNGMTSFQLITHQPESFMVRCKLYVEDFDADGDYDIAVMREDRPCFFVSMSDGMFNEPMIFGADMWERYQYPIDLNGDNFLDWLQVIGSNTLALRMGSEAQPLGGNETTFGSVTYQTMVVDLNDDGKLDFLTLGPIDSMTEYISNGGVYTDWTIINTEIPSISVEVAFDWRFIDFDNNGWKDFIWDGFGDTFKVEYNSENGFTQESLISGKLTNDRPAVVDMNHDGLDDLFLIVGNQVVLHLNQGNGIFEPYGVSFNHIQNAHKVEYADFEQGGPWELMIAGQDEIFLNKIMISPFTEPIEGHVFHDANGNGTQDSGEDYMSNFQVQINSNNQNAYSQGGANFLLTGDAGEFEILPIYDASIWEITTDSLAYHFAITGPGDVPTYPLEFGFHAIGDNPDAKLWTTTYDWSCATEDFQTSTAVINEGNAYLTGVVSMSFTDEILDVISYVDQPDSIVGNTIYWSVVDLVPTEMETFKVLFENPGVNYMGQHVQFTTHFQRTIQGAQQPLIVQQLNDWEITCSYDPNDKTVTPTGFDSEGYIDGLSGLNYTIRFQNTGNATAAQVILYDQLSAYLDYSSFELLGSSHPVSVQLKEDGLLTFRFDDIYLPYASLNNHGSCGYVTFKLDPLPYLEPGTKILNEAYIVFDNNPAIQTNLVLNTIYTCEWLYSPLTIEMNETSLYVNDNAHSYQWYLNGAALPGETSAFHLISPADSGSFYVAANYETGCVIPTEEYLLNERPMTVEPDPELLLFPNPGNGRFNIVSGKFNGYVTVYNSAGQKIYGQKVLSNTIGAIELSLSAGVYIFEFIDDRTHQEINRRMMVLLD